MVSHLSISFCNRLRRVHLWELSAASAANKLDQTNEEDIPVWGSFGPSARSLIQIGQSH